jgi:hypothetical protein
MNALALLETMQSPEEERQIIRELLEKEKTAQEYLLLFYDF